MKGFPKAIKTKSDLVNTHKLVLKGRLDKEDWLAAVEKLENQNWIACPVIELSEDRKTVTIMFCNEAAAEQKVKNGSVYPTINAVETVTLEQTEEEIAENKTPIVHTVLTLSKALLTGTTTVFIPAAVTYYDRLGITEAEVEEMKGALA